MTEISNNLAHDQIQKQIVELQTHPHIKQITLIKPFTYKLVYWPQDLDSLYSEMMYNIKLTLPENYPEKAPFLTFLDKIYHLNIHPVSGQVFMSILRDDWSPFINLKAVISTLDDLLLQPDQQNAATTTLLQQYQQDIDKYVDNVKAILLKNIKKNGPVKQSITEQQIVEQVIQIKDLNYDTGQNFKTKQNQQNITKEQNKSANITPFKSPNKNTQRKGEDEKQQVREQQADKNGKAGDQRQKQKKSQSKQKNKIGIQKYGDQISSIVKYDETIKQSRDLINDNSLKKQNYDGLKQIMIKCKQLIKIYSQQLQQLQKQSQNKNSKRLKNLFTSKCNRLQQMLIQLFEISQKINIKLMQTVRNDFKKLS